MKKRIIPLFLVVFLLCACFPNEPVPTQPSIAVTEPSHTDTTPTTEPSTIPTEPSTVPTEPYTVPTEPSTAPTEPPGEPLDEEQLRFFESLFAYPDWYNTILTTIFASPEEANLYMIFYNGVAEDGLMNFQGPLTQEEIDLIPDYEAPYAYDRSTGAEIDAVLRRYLGISLEESHKIGLDWFIYVEKLDSYYHKHTDANALIDFKFHQGYTLPDGTIQLHFQRYRYPEIVINVITLKQVNYEGQEVYQVISNLELE